jgi:iron complex outermembrane receptor protein
VYGSVSKGYLPGESNYASAQNLASFSYGLETSQNAELGYKSLFFEEQMSFNVAAFYIKNKSKQIVDLFPGFIQSISNAAKTKSYGLELSSQYTNQAGVLFYAQLGLNKAQAKKYETNTFQNFTLVTNSLARNTLPLAPKLTYGVCIKYDQGHGFFSNLNINGSSKYYFDVANSVSQPSNNRVNGELGYHLEHYSVSFIVQNAFDQEIISRAVQTNLGMVVEDTAPRYMGFKLAMEW